MTLIVVVSVSATTARGEMLSKGSSKKNRNGMTFLLSVLFLK